MRLLILLAALAAAGGCTHIQYQPELTVLWGPRRYEGHEDTALTLMLLQRFGSHGVVGCLHQSEVQHGQPFNEEDEETFDTCGLGGRWGGKQK